MAQLFLKYGLIIDSSTFSNNIKRIINQLYKLLPMREEGKDWQKPLQTLIEELSGLQRLVYGQESRFLTILSKMEGLFNLTNDAQDMPLYRRTIFECLSLLSILNTDVTKS